MQKIISENQRVIKEICKQLKVKRLHIFGSAVTDKFTDHSDIDFLLAFPDTLSIEEYTDNYFALHYKLNEVFKRKIDLVTERSLSNPYFIESVNESKVLLYEA